MTETSSDISFPHIKEYLTKPSLSNNGQSNNSYTYLTRQDIPNKSASLSHKPIEFEKSCMISSEDYNNTIDITNTLIYNFTHEYVCDIFSITKLSPMQQTLIELVIYLLDYDYFDWINIKEQLIYELRSKLSKITYGHISMAKFNYLLNKLCRDNNGKFPQFISPFSMNYLYQWLKCQIKIILYKFQNKVGYIKDNKGDYTTRSESGPKQNPQPLLNNKSTSTNACISVSVNQSPIKCINKRSIIQKKMLQLEKYDFIKEKKQRETGAIKALPLLYNRSYNQMRKVYSFPFQLKQVVAYNMNTKHINEVQNASVRGIKDKKQLIDWISTKKTVALNGVPQYKVKRLLKGDDNNEPIKQ